MIPENIKKLLKSSNQDDVRIGFSLAKTLNLENNGDFQWFCYTYVNKLQLYVDREWGSRVTETPYKYFRIKE